MSRVTLRSMIDGMALAGVQQPPVAKPQPNPMMRQPAMDPKMGTNKLPQNTKQSGSAKSQGTALATHVSNHLQDPIGTTKEGFDELQQKKLEYDMAKENMSRELAPVQSVIDHVSQMHDLNKNGIPDELEDPNDPNAPMQKGNSMMQGDQGMGYHGPNNAGQPGGMPQNMQQQPGRMQQGAPGKAVSYPGAGPKIPGAPAQQAKPEAPAAKAAPKGQMRPGKQAQRGIKVSVRAADGISNGVSRRIRSSFAAAELGNMSCCSDSKAKMEAGGPGSGRRPGGGSGGKSPDWSKLAEEQKRTIAQKFVSNKHADESKIIQNRLVRYYTAAPVHPKDYQGMKMQLPQNAEWPRSGTMPSNPRPRKLR